MPENTYDPGQLVVSFRGNILTGFAPGTFLRVERNEDNFTLVVGADGEHARARSRNKSAKVTFTLMQTSASNDILSAAAATDEIGGDGTGAFLAKDLSGRTVAEAEVAWVKKYPGLEFSNEVGNREWELESGRLALTVGGN